MNPLGLRPCASRALRAAALACGIAQVVGLAACSSETSPASACVVVSASCSPLYPPTFDQIFTRTLTPTCAQPGALCHSAEGEAGGLAFADQKSSYALLLATSGGTAQVIPGNPSCSPLIERLTSTDATELMPPGDMLSSAERCSFIQWIAQGATE